MSLTFKGIKANNEAAPLLDEYLLRKRLKDIGYSFDADDLSVFKAEAFGIIAMEINRLEAESMKERTKKGARGG